MAEVFKPTKTLNQFIDHYSIEYNGQLRQPKSWQYDACQFLLQNSHALLGDEMGLGKTLSSILACLEKKANKVLIICPASLKYNWKRELLIFNKFIKEEEICLIDKDWNVTEKTRFVIISYNTLKNHHIVGQKKDRPSHILKWSPNQLIVDEAHFVKNAKSQRSKLVTNISRSIKSVWLLTGTPISNRPIDFYQLLSILRHPIAKNYFSFGQKYCDGYNAGFGWNFQGASNLKDLHNQTKSILMRRTKIEMREKFPDEFKLGNKIRTPLFIQMNKKEQKIYENCVAEKFSQVQELIKQAHLDHNTKDPNWMREISDGDQLIELSTLKRVLAQTKIPYTIELINDHFESDQSKVIVFTNYEDVIQTLKQAFPKQSVILTGKQNSIDKDKAVQAFQNDPNITIMLANIIAGGTGHTMTKAGLVIMNDLAWNPDVHDQAEDRTYRMGQDLPIINILYPLFVNSIETIIFQIILAKKNIVAQIIDDQNLDKQIEEIEQTETQAINKTDNILELWRKIKTKNNT